MVGGLVIVAVWLLYVALIGGIGYWNNVVRPRRRG
jgi:hypothetical protein